MSQALLLGNQGKTAAEISLKLKYCNWTQTKYYSWFVLQTPHLMVHNDILYLIWYIYILGFYYLKLLGFPGSSDGGKESACNAGKLGSIPWSGRPSGERKGNPPQYSCLENSMDKRSLAGYSPWGHRVGHNWVTNTHTHTHTHTLSCYACKWASGKKKIRQTYLGWNVFQYFF